MKVAHAVYDEESARLFHTAVVIGDGENRQYRYVVVLHRPTERVLQEAACFTTNVYYKYRCAKIILSVKKNVQKI